MTAVARTPEELEVLLEDAVVTGDRMGASQLFTNEAVLVVADDPREVRGREQIAELCADLWHHQRTYVADPRRVVRARDVALVLSHAGVAVLRRAGDGSWRYAISLVSFTRTTTDRYDGRRRQADERGARAPTDDVSEQVQHTGPAQHTGG